MSAPLPAEAGLETWERIVLLLVLFRNNNIATNLQRFTSTYGQCCHFSWVAAKSSRSFSLL